MPGEPPPPKANEPGANEPGANEPSVSITAHLPSSKTDTRKQGVNFVAATGPVNTGTARILQWVALVDAMRGSTPNTPLFCSLQRHGIPRPARASSGSDWRLAFNTLQEKAGLSGFTPHSTRVGFAVTATEHGHNDVDIQDSMRLRTPSLVQRYAKQARNTNRGSNSGNGGGSKRGQGVGFVGLAGALATEEHGQEAEHETSEKAAS